MTDTPASHIRNALTILNVAHDSCWPEVAMKVDPRDLDAIRIRLVAALALLEAK